MVTNKNIRDKDNYCRTFITWNQSEIIELLQVAKQNGLTSYFITLLLTVMRPSLYSHMTPKTEPQKANISNSYSKIFNELKKIVEIVDG